MAVAGILVAPKISDFLEHSEKGAFIPRWGIE
jgi:hypothetical protein